MRDLQALSDEGTTGGIYRSPVSQVSTRVFFPLGGLRILGCWDLDGFCALGLRC